MHHYFNRRTKSLAKLAYVKSLSSCLKKEEETYLGLARREEVGSNRRRWRHGEVRLVAHTTGECGGTWRSRSEAATRLPSREGWSYVVLSAMHWHMRAWWLGSRDYNVGVEATARDRAWRMTRGLTSPENGWFGYMGEGECKCGGSLEGVPGGTSTRTGLKFSSWGFEVQTTPMRMGSEGGMCVSQFWGGPHFSALSPETV